MRNIWECLLLYGPTSSYLTHEWVNYSTQSTPIDLCMGLRLKNTPQKICIRLAPGCVLVWFSASQRYSYLLPYSGKLADAPLLVNGAHRICVNLAMLIHDDVIKWKHFPRYWPFVRGIHRSTANSPRKGQWRGALMFSLICVWINCWVNTREAGDLRRYRGHSDVTVMHTEFMIIQRSVSHHPMTQFPSTHWMYLKKSRL